MRALNEVASEYGLEFDTSKTEFTDFGYSKGL
jgi:hypothetical protein